MIFNSATFAIFLVLAFCVYWRFDGRLRAQNLVLLVASYVFYGWWDWRFLFLLAGTSAVDYLATRVISGSSDQGVRKGMLFLSVGSNLAVLGFFKYFNFFADSVETLLQAIGFHPEPLLLHVILPVGISFYTFQSISYVVDVYKGRTQPAPDALTYFAYNSFFPQLMAGPVERAGHLLPQFANLRSFDPEQAREGMRMILWGLFKKMVVADNLAQPVDHIFRDFWFLSGGELALGAVLFMMQIYCDFSGYSDMAKGLGRLFGIDLIANFRTPYFALSLQDFWHRWNISISNWFRDYVYIPLGGNRVSRPRWGANIVITFTASGLWHGAGWPYIIWGALHGFGYLFDVFFIERIYKSIRHPVARAAYSVFRYLYTIAIVGVAFVFFRSASFWDAANFLKLGLTNFSVPSPASLILLTGPIAVLLVEWIARHRPFTLDIGHWPTPVRWAVYYVLVLSLLWFGNLNYVPFIYFQF